MSEFDTSVLFYVGLHHPSAAKNFDRCMVSVNRLRNRKSDFEVNEWIMDSGAFSEISTHGEYRSGPEEYAEQIKRWSRCGNMVAAVSQDYMCDPFILDITGKTVEEHQKLTIDRYDKIKSLCPDQYIMPVLQGYTIDEYLRHIEMYGERLEDGMWVGTGSVCKKNSSIIDIERILVAIKSERPKLRLHGFGIKHTALSSYIVRVLLYSADSMAWSFAARRQGGDANDWREAKKYIEKIQTTMIQEDVFLSDWLKL